jgi:sirohydrochlorin ferrochelatase
MTGFVLFAHGSSVESANDTVRSFTARFAAAGNYLAEPAFLELAEPALPAAISLLLARGASRIVVIPYFLTLGIHLQRDLPRIVSGIAALHPGLTIDIAPPLDGHPALLDIVLDRASSAAHAPGNAA